MISRDQLLAIMPLAKARVDKYLEPLNATMAEFSIDNGLREAAFLAQLAHESGSLRYVEELASGAAYEGRTTLGNTQPGDGPRFKGRGLIQITGRANYTALSEYFGVDFVGTPALLSDPEWACRSAGWFWKARDLNTLADKGDFLLITRRINGGTNGYDQRLAFYNKALEIL